MSETWFERLDLHLDQLPGGFAPSATGADIRLLQGLLSAAKADPTLHLTLDQESADVIAERSNLSRRSRATTR